MANVLGVGMIVQTTFVCSMGGQFSNNIRHWKCISITGAGSTDLRMGEDLSGVLGPLYRANLPANARWEGVKVQVILPTRLVPVSYTDDAGVGSIAGDAMSPQTCGLLRLSTPFAGRKNRGRMYLPFPPEGENGADGRPTVGFKGQAEQIGTFLISDLSVGDVGNQAVMSLVLKGDAGTYSRGVTGYRFVDAWATQRRRSLVGRGDANPLS